MLPPGPWRLIQTAVTEFHTKYEVDTCDSISNLQIFSGFPLFSHNHTLNFRSAYILVNYTCFFVFF